MTTLDQIIDEERELPVEERQRLRAALERLDSNSGPSTCYGGRQQERGWINAHRDEYLRQWVALEGDRLVAHGTDARQVYLAARDAGIDAPYVERVERREDAFTAGWL